MWPTCLDWSSRIPGKEINGYRIVNPDTVFRLKNELVPNAKWNQDLGEIQSINVSCSNLATPCPDILVRIKTDEGSLNNPADPAEEEEDEENPSASFPVVDPAISVRIKEEEGSCIQSPSLTSDMDCAYSPSTGLPVISSFCSLNLKEELYSKDAERGDVASDPTATGGSSLQPDQLLQNKQEEEEYIGTDSGTLGSVNTHCPAIEGGRVDESGRHPEDYTGKLKLLEMASKHTVGSVQQCSVGGDSCIMQDLRVFSEKRTVKLQKRKNFRRPPQPILPRSSDPWERPGAIGSFTALQISHTGNYLEPSWKKESRKAKRTANSGAPLYKCNVCEKSFSKAFNLKVHRNVHTGDKPYKCPHCEKCFTQNSGLVIHRRTHTGERPYKCTECEKTFTQISHAITHQRTHTGERPYKRTACEKTFSQSAGLLTHQQIHTGEKPYKCVECGRCFCHHSSFMAHQKMHRNSGSWKY